MKYYSRKYNQQVTKGEYNYINCIWLVGTSETLRVQKRKINSLIKSDFKNYDENNEIKFNQWLAGLIDGDGCFIVNQKGYTSCEIMVASDNEKVLRIIQNKVGGAIKLRSGTKAVRIRFQNKSVMISLINRVNGFIYNSVRIPQFARVCEKLNVPIILPNYDNVPLPWYMGMLDANGTINFYPHFKNGIHYRNQLTISVSNKHYHNLVMFKEKYGGHIYFDKSGSGKFQWKINSKIEHLNFYDLFLSYPCKTIKANRLFLIKEYYELVTIKAFINTSDNFQYKRWIHFLKKWNNKII